MQNKDSQSKLRNKKYVQRYSYNKRGPIKRECPKWHKTKDDNKNASSSPVNVAQDNSYY